MMGGIFFALLHTHFFYRMEPLCFYPEQQTLAEPLTSSSRSMRPKSSLSRYGMKEGKRFYILCMEEGEVW